MLEKTNQIKTEPEMLYVIRVPENDISTRWLAIAVPESKEEIFRSDFIKAILDRSTLDFESYQARIVEQGEAGESQPSPEQYKAFEEAFGDNASNIDAPSCPKHFFAGYFDEYEKPKDTRPDGERVKPDQKVAFTVNGTALEPYEGLRRFLNKTYEDIKTDKHHMMEELTCDLASIIETGLIIQEAGSGHPEHVLENPAMSAFTIASASAAIYLLHSLNSQRAGKEVEYKRALRMFHDHERDKKDPKNGETREERFEAADANLARKMRASGLQFVQLSDKQKKFDKAFFREEARQRGIGLPVTAHLVERTGAFMRQDFNTKLAVTGEALSHIKYKTAEGVRSAAREIGRLTQIYIGNTTRFGEVWKSTVSGFQEAHGLTKDLNSREQDNKDGHEINARIQKQTHKTRTQDDIAVESGSESEKDATHAPLTLADLNKVNLQTIEAIGHAIDDEEKEAIIRTLNDQRLHEQNARRARTSLCVQSVFQASQAILIPVKLMNEEYRSSVPLNIVAFLGAMGPLKGFAEELKNERAKANSKQAERAERIGKLLNLTTGELSKKKSGSHNNDDDDDHDDNFNDMDNEATYAETDPQEEFTPA